MWTSEDEKSNQRCNCLFRKVTIQLTSISSGLTMKCPSQDDVLNTWSLAVETIFGRF